MRCGLRRCELRLFVTALRSQHSRRLLLLEYCLVSQRFFWSLNMHLINITLLVVWAEAVCCCAGQLTFSEAAESFAGPFTVEAHVRSIDDEDVFEPGIGKVGASCPKNHYWYPGWQGAT